VLLIRQNVVLPLGFPAVQLHKLVDTQGDLQLQLTSQLAAAQADTCSQEQQATALQQQLTDSQAAVAALADELQVMAAWLQL